MGCCCPKPKKITRTQKAQQKYFKPLVVNNRWKSVRFLGKGAYGRVFEVIDLWETEEEESTGSISKTTKSLRSKKEVTKKQKERYAIKLEFMKPKSTAAKTGRLPHEASILEELHMGGYSMHTPVVYDHGSLGQGFQFVVMTMLGPSFDRLMKGLPQKMFSPQTVAIAAKQIIEAMRQVHTAGFLHRDIKPDNFVVGLDPNRHRIYLIDFGLCRKFVDQSGHQLRPRKHGVYRGTLDFMSPTAAKCAEQSPKDDLWSVFYTLLDIRTGSLPWLKCRTSKEACEMKSKINPNVWLEIVEPQYVLIYDCLSSLDYQDTPNYNYLHSLCDAMMKHLNVDPLTPFDWEPGGHYYHSYDPEALKRMFPE